MTSYQTLQTGMTSDQTFQTKMTFWSRPWSGDILIRNHLGLEILMGGHFGPGIVVRGHFGLESLIRDNFGVDTPIIAQFGSEPQAGKLESAAEQKFAGPDRWDPKYTPDHNNKTLHFNLEVKNQLILFGPFFDRTAVNSERNGNLGTNHRFNWVSTLWFQ